MDHINLKEPESPKLSIDFNSYFKNERMPGASVTYPANLQTRNTPWESRSFPKAVSDDPKRLLTRFSKVNELPSNDLQKTPLFYTLSSRRNVKRPTNIDLNSLRVLRRDEGNRSDCKSSYNMPESPTEETHDGCYVNERHSEVNDCLETESEKQDNFPEDRNPLQTHCSVVATNTLQLNYNKSNVMPSATLKCEQASVKSSENLKHFNEMVAATASKDEMRETCNSKFSPDDMIRINGHSYKLMRIIGRGGSSNVYEAYNEQRKLVAIKSINLANVDKSASESYINEINVLKRLQHSDRIIKLFDYEFDQANKYLRVALERGDTDFATFLGSRSAQNRITAEMIKFYWSEMLRGVEIIHNAGIVHSDLKPANFLIVKGHLKLIDFGISSFIPSDATSVFKDTRVGSLSYISPEALIDVQSGNDGSKSFNCASKNAEPLIKIGVQSDVWSLGCILYHMAYGVTPFQHIKNMMQIMLAIANPAYEIVYPPLHDKLLLDVMKKCIVREPKERASIRQLLAHPYLTGEPQKNLDSFISELMVNLSPASTDKVNKALEQMQLDKKILSQNLGTGN